jgi:hypothetical protein
MLQQLISILREFSIIPIPLFRAAIPFAQLEMISLCYITNTHARNLSRLMRMNF